MSVFEPNSPNFLGVVIFCFHLKKTAAEAHRMLSSTYGEAVLSKRTCREWFQRFKSDDFDVEDHYGGGKQKIFDSVEGNCAPYKLKPRDVERRFFACKELLASKRESERVFTSHCEWRRKMGPLR